MISRRGMMSGAALAAAAPMAPANAAGGGALRIAMTAADIPTTHGIPNNGFEGFRFLGYQPYDALVNWNLRDNPDKPANIEPGLFTAWHADEANPLRWIFTVRQGVKFHDGADFNADAVIWNLRRVYDDKSPQYDATSAPIIRAAVSMVDTFEKTDDSTIIMTTKYPFSFFPWLLTRVLMVSPVRWEETGRNWSEFAKKPAGTGPFKILRVVPGQYVEMARNDEYWNKDRIPRVEKLFVHPMPEAITRVAALRSGQVDWIEVPAPDAIPSLKGAGFNVLLWAYPHTYPYVLNTGEKAKSLLAEAGYGPNKPVRAKIMISTSGSGQMLPIPMNEFMQQNCKAVGIDIEFDVVEWGAMLVAIRNDPKAPQSHGVHGVNISLSSVDPSTMFRYYAIDSFSPTNYNWGHWANPEATALLKKAQASFDAKEQTALLAKAHAIVVDEAAWLFMCHDLNPRAMAKKVRGFQPVQSWFVDLTTITTT